MAFKGFKSVTHQHLVENEHCPRCQAQMLRVMFSDSSTKTVCSVHEHHDGELCRQIGHAEAWSATTECSVCAAPARWVRVEVTEGKAYTYVDFEDEPLAPGDLVTLPGNVVQGGRFKGRVLRVLPEASHDYPGPYKAVLGLACACPKDGYDDDCRVHGGLL